VRTPHLSCKRGKRVRILLRGGEEIIAKFEDRTARYVVLEGGRKIACAQILSFGLYREHGNNKLETKE
jgi:hypothetical protein